MNKKDLSQKNKKELLKLAINMSIPGSGKMSKSELIIEVLLELNKKAEKNTLLGKKAKQAHDYLDIQEEVEDAKYYTGSEENHDFYVEAAFDEKYEDDRVVLMVVSPSMIYAYWEISAKTLKKLSRRRKNTVVVMLRISYFSTSTQQEVFFDVPTEGADNWYINTPESGCSYWVEIGTKNSKGVFSSVMTSNTLDVPRVDFSEVLEEVWTAEESEDCFEEEDFEEDIQIQVEDEPSQTLLLTPVVPPVVEDSEVREEPASEVYEPDRCGDDVCNAEPQEHDVTVTTNETLSSDTKEGVAFKPPEQKVTTQIPEAEEKHDVHSEPADLNSAQSLKRADFFKKVYALSMGARFDYKGKTFILSGESAGVSKGLSSAELALLSSPELFGVSSAELSSLVSSNIGAGEAGKPAANEEGEKPGRKFWYVLDAELIVYGATESDAHVTLRGEPIKLREDGTFTVRFPLPDGVIDIPVVFESGDRVDKGVIETKVTRETEYR